MLPLTLRGNMFWSQWQDSNLRFPAPKAGDLTGLAYTEIGWLRIRESNSANQ